MSITAQPAYTRVLFPQDADAYRRGGAYHAANITPEPGGCCRTLCGKRMTGADLHCFADEPHEITCRKCRRILEAR